MSEDATPRLGLPYLAAAQAQKHVTVNEAFDLIDALVDTALRSRTTAIQPSAPLDGDLYLLPAGASGSDWSARTAGTVVRWAAGAWTAPPVPVGALAFLLDEATTLVKAADGWGDLGVSIRLLDDVIRVGIGATASADNPLTVSGPGALITHPAGGGGAQLRINKAAAGDVASVLFQTGFSARAEVGAVGDDGLHLRTSPDGAAWSDAVVVAADGKVGVGVAAPTSRLQVAGAVRVATVAKAALPSAAGEGSGAILFVLDEAGGATLAVSDGTAWRRTADLAVVS